MNYGAGCLDMQPRKILYLQLNRHEACKLGLTLLVENCPGSARRITMLQMDEVDMGMTYEELGIYGRLRKISRCGPVSMFRRLLVDWQDRCAIFN